MQGWRRKTLDFGVLPGTGNWGKGELSRNSFAPNYRYTELFLKYMQLICIILSKFLHIFIDFDFFGRPYLSTLLPD